MRRGGGMVGKGADMTYRFKSSDRNVEAALRRVALSQIDSALAQIADKSLGPEQTVHEVRKSCKKLRALLRLVRPGFAPYRQENQSFRDMARTLGSVRDQDVLVTTCDRVSAHYGGRADRNAIASIRARLMQDKTTAASNGELQQRLRAFKQAMQQAQDRVAGWRLEQDGFDAFAQGLACNLKRARKAMAAARQDPVAENLHEWRKDVKYHWYHARLLRNIWPGPMDAHVKASSALADLLGDHHDLAVLRQKLTEKPRHYGDPDLVCAFAGLVSKRETAAEKRAFEIGTLLLAEQPQALARRWGRYWALWRGED